MMLGEESEPAEFWKSVGDEVLRRGIKRLVLMGMHPTKKQNNTYLTDRSMNFKVPIGK